MDSAVNIIIVGPVLVNVMAQAGFPEVQAAIVVIVGFLIGSVTPPVGVAYFTAATIAQVRLEKVATFSRRTCAIVAAVKYATPTGGVTDPIKKPTITTIAACTSGKPA